MRVEVKVIKDGRNDIDVGFWMERGKLRRLRSTGFLLCQWGEIGRLRGRKCELCEDDIRS